jgi:hypothetical protein
MTSVTTKPELSQPTIENNSHLFDDWLDSIETGIRDRVRGLIEEMICAELDAVLSRPRYGRRAKPGESDDAGVAGHRHGSRMRTLTGTFGKTEIAVPRAPLKGCDGKTTEWKSRALRAYQRRTLAADALIAGTYLAGTNTRRVRRALCALFGEAVGKDTVSRVWRKVKNDWDAIAILREQKSAWGHSRRRPKGRTPALGERSGAPSGLRPSSLVMCNTPVEVQFTSAGCLHYPCLLRGEPLELVAREANVSIG